MWMDKLDCGVLRVMTLLGPRYIQLSFWERVYLMWMFRNFHTLPQIVLTPRQQQFIERLCSEQKFIAMPDVVGGAPILGTVERRPVVENFALKSAATGVVESASPLATDPGQGS
jgi:hypothetical protein